MRKIVTTIALVAVIGIFINQSAEARWGKGPANGYGPGSCGNCDKNATVDEATRQAFFDETEEMRTQLMSLRSQYFALMNSDETDKDEAQILWSEMFDLQQQIHDKATEAGLTSGGGPGSDYGQGRGRGRGCGGGGNFGPNSGAPGCNSGGCGQINSTPPAQQ